MRSKTFYTVRKQFYTYALFDESEKSIYVGKSAAKNPKKRYYDHLNDFNVQTEDFLDYDGREPPRFTILVSFEGTGAEAYKHQLAWVRFFYDNGFIIIAAENTYNQAMNLSDETREIYNRVCAPYSLDEVLNRKIQIEHSCSEAVETKEKIVKNLNIRLEEDSLKRFNVFCKDNGLTQSAGIDRLLCISKESLCNEEISRLKKEVEKLQEMNFNALIEEREKTKKATRRYRESLEVIGEMVREYSKALDKREVISSDTIDLMSSWVSKEMDLHKRYSYPSKSGVCFLKTEHIAYGEARAAMFIFGTNSDGEKIKLRFYDKKEYVGVKPTEDNVKRVGAYLLVAYIDSDDGATDIIGAMDASKLKFDNAQKNGNIDGAKCSLDEMIRKASAHNKKFR